MVNIKYKRYKTPVFPFSKIYFVQKTHSPQLFHIKKSYTFEKVNPCSL